MGRSAVSSVPRAWVSAATGGCKKASLAKRGSVSLAIQGRPESGRCPDPVRLCGVGRPESGRRPYLACFLHSKPPRPSRRGPSSKPPILQREKGFGPTWNTSPRWARGPLPSTVSAAGRLCDREEGYLADIGERYRQHAGACHPRATSSLPVEPVERTASALAPPTWAPSNPHEEGCMASGEPIPALWVNSSRPRDKVA